MGAVNLSDPQSLNMYSYVGNDPVNRVDPDGQFWGALFRFFAGLFSSLRPNIITGSFTFGNHPPISVSFTPNFQNIGVGYGNVGLTLRSDGQWLPELLSKVRETLTNPECAEFAKSILNSVASKKNPIYPAGGMLADVFEAFLNQPKTHELFTTKLPSGSLGYGNPVGNIRKSTAAIALKGTPTADGVIGELFHLAARDHYFDDKQLADAVRLFPKYASVSEAALDPLLNIYDPRYKGYPEWTRRIRGLTARISITLNGIFVKLDNLLRACDAYYLNDRDSNNKTAAVVPAGNLLCNELVWQVVARDRSRSVNAIGYGSVVGPVWRRQRAMSV